MGLFDWLSGNNRLRLETPDDDPEAKRLRMAQRKHDYDTVTRFFRTYKPTRATRWQRNFFAFASFALTSIRANKEAAAEFDRIGNRPPSCPWYFIGDPIQSFLKFRNLARTTEHGRTRR